MADKKEKLKPSEYASRALSGMSQGLRGHAVTSAGGMGLLFLTPEIRNQAFAARDVASGIPTKTPEQISGLADKLLRAGKRDPDIGRKVIFQPMAEKGYADVVQEWTRKGGKSRDILRLGLDVAPESVAHEVGHLTGNAPWTKALRAVSGLSRTAPALALPSLLALSGALSKNEEDVPAYAKAAPIVGGAQLATILGEEARANVGGAKLMKNIGHAIPLLKRLKMFLPTATYLGHGGLLIGAPLGILKGLELYNKSRKQKKSFDPRKLLRSSPEELQHIPQPTEAKKKWEKRFQEV